MVNAKGKSTVSISNPMEIKCQDTGVASCGSKDTEVTASKGVTNEEHAIPEVENGRLAMEGEKNEGTASVEEENNKGNKREDQKNDSNEQNATEDEEEDDVEDDDEEDDEEEAEEEIGEEKEENTIQQEEKVEPNSTENVKTPRKRGRKKKMEEEREVDEEENGEENENTNEQEKDKLGANSGDKVKRPKKRSRMNKITVISSQTLATKKEEDKPGASGNKKEFRRAESMGMIFMCSSKTKKDCYRYNVLGLPASKREIVQKIYKGMRLFLFDFDLRLMYGIYKAAGPGGYNIEPEAFKSAFPSQVRFTVLDDCLPLAEEKFKTVIKENYYGKNKFDCQLNSKQVKDLCKLFVASNRGSKSKKLSRNTRAEARTRADRGRIRRRGQDTERRPTLLADHRRRDSRPTAYDRETYRRQNRDEERRSPLVGAHGHHDHPIMYERELAPLHRLPPLPPPAAGVPPYSSTLPYASYGRTLDVDAYGRDLAVERRDPRLLDLDIRHRDEIGIRDPYVSYREIPSYRDTLYSSAIPAPPEYYAPVEQRAEYRLAAPPPLEYRHPATAPSEYDRLRPLYRY